MNYKRLGMIGVFSLVAINLVIASQPGALSQSVAETAVLRGKIRFTGTIPTPVRVNMASDPACAPFTNSTETVQVSDQGLENVMVYVSSSVATSVPAASAVTLDHRSCRFVPHVVTVQAGQTLIVRNSDPTLHNVHAYTQINSAYNIGQPVPMDSTHVFDKPEAQIRIRDDVHGWESAYVGVFSHPYHTVSKTGGLYELRLPAGSYEITVWHEQYGMSQQSVRVGPGENPALDFAFKEP